jgi:Flp pilus assembly pilin Flp
MSDHDGEFEEYDNENETPKRDRRFGERGTGLVEYSLLTALIALAAIGALGYFGESNESGIDDSAQTVTDAIDLP